MMPLDVGGTFWTKHSVVMVWFRHELTDVVMCCTQTQWRERTWNQTCSTQWHGTDDISSESRARSKGDVAPEKMSDPTAGSPATGKSVAGIINLFVDDLFGTGETEIEQRVSARLRKDFQVGSEDWNDVLFTGQRFPWMKNPQLGPIIEASQEEAIEKLEGIPVETNTK